MEKSYVGTGAYICPVCAKRHSEEVLVNTKLKKTLEKDMSLGWQLCPEHKEQRTNGFVFLVGIDESKSKQTDSLNGIWRTGKVIAIKENVYNQIFNIPIDERKIAFCDDETIDKLNSMVEE
jgi:hypothetical protein